MGSVILLALLFVALDLAPLSRVLSVLPAAVALWGALGRKNIECVNIWMWLAAMSGWLAALFSFSSCRTHMDVMCAPESIAILNWIPVALWVRRFPARRMSQVVLASILIAALLTSVQLVWQRIDGAERPPAFSFNVLVAGQMVSLSLLSLAFKGPKWLQGAAFGFSIFAALLTGAKIGFFLAFMPLIWLIRYRREWVFLYVGVMVVWALLVLGALSRFLGELYGYSHASSTSAGLRLDSILWAANHFWDHPILGIGNDAITEGFLHRWVEWNLPEPARTTSHLHNGFLQVTLSRGLLAGFFFSLMWILLIFVVYKAARGGRGLACLFSILSLFFLSLVDAPNIWGANALCVSAIVGVVLAQAHNEVA